MTRSNRPPRSDPGPQHSSYPGESLGLPEHGPGSLVGMGRRMVALLVDWLIALGLAHLAVSFHLMTNDQFLYSRSGATAVVMVWLVSGVLAVRLYSFTPGQFACGLRVASVDQRLNVGIGRAAVRGALIFPVVPALFVDSDGRGIHDVVTGTAVVRR